MTCSQCAYQFCYGCLGDRATYRAGAHEGCDRIAAQFELDGVRVLAEVRKLEIAARRQAKFDARAERRRVARVERLERERVQVAAALAADAIVRPSQEADVGFDVFAAFASLDEPLAPQHAMPPARAARSQLLRSAVLHERQRVAQHALRMSA
jgi:hypothetical protein